MERGGERRTELLVLSKGDREKKRGTPSWLPLSPHRVPPLDLLALHPVFWHPPHPFFLISFQFIHAVINLNRDFGDMAPCPLYFTGVSPDESRKEGVYGRNRSLKEGDGEHCENMVGFSGRALTASLLP